MSRAETIQQIKEKWPEAILEEKIDLGETTLLLHKAALKEILAYLKQLPEDRYEFLIDLTGVDYLQPKKQTKVVYWLHNPTQLNRLRLAVYVERGESLPSVIELWRGAAWYERELFDLFGVHFEGHAGLKRILMPDDWVGHPLRRDYALTEEPVQFKHGVKPKVPSEIIPYVKPNHTTA